MLVPKHGYLRNSLSLQARLGFVFVDETPFDDAIHTKRLLERIGPIRETHYGGFYDFTPDMAKADTAYSNIALPPHTDTTYFTDPAGLQAFHLLSHTSSPDAPKAFGGESLLVDGFHAARLLKNENKDHFSELTGRCLSWHASGNKGVAITTEQLFPVIELDTNFDFRRPPAKIRWNNDDRGGEFLPGQGQRRRPPSPEDQSPPGNSSDNTDATWIL